MMKTSGNNLSMIRGDTESITVSIKDIDFVDGDIVEMTVREHADSAYQSLYYKITEFTDGDALIAISSEDTEELMFGNYEYDIQWTDTSGNIITLIVGTFTLCKEVTYGSDN